MDLNLHWNGIEFTSELALEVALEWRLLFCSHYILARKFKVDQDFSSTKNLELFVPKLQERTKVFVAICVF